MSAFFGPIRRDSVAGVRQKAYTDGYNRNPKNPPEDEKLRGIYLTSYRRGAEARARA